MVWSGMKEQAELYWELLNDSGLTMAPLEQGWLHRGAVGHTRSCQT